MIQISVLLEASMVINFKVLKISRGTCKLIWTPIITGKKKTIWKEILSFSIFRGYLCRLTTYELTYFYGFSATPIYLSHSVYELDELLKKNGYSLFLLYFGSDHCCFGSNQCVRFSILRTG